MQQKWIIPSSFLIAVAVSFLLFVFMANLIKHPDRTIVDTDIPKPIVLFNPTKLLSDHIKDPAKIKPISKTTPPPPREKIDISETQDPIRPTLTQPTTLSLAGLPGLAADSFGSGLLGKKDQQVSDKDAVPIIQITPQYPPDAARKGIEGWVALSFSIDKTGSVTNVEVLDASPAHVFDNAAKKAIKRWRYNAKFVAGQPVFQDNVQVRLDFSLDNIH